MKLTVVRSKFCDGLRMVQNIVQTKATLPILQNVLIEAKDSVMTLTTTDLDISIKVKIDCEVIEPGATTLPVKFLFNMVSKTTEGLITLDSNNETNLAEIRGLNTKFDLVGIREEDFPRLPANIESYSYEIPCVLLKEMIRKTIYAIYNAEGHEAMSGLFFQFQNSKLSVVAADGKRMAMIENEVIFPEEAAIEFIMPQKTIQELYRSLGNDGNVSIKVQGTQVSFETANLSIFSKKIDKKYPNFRAIIPPNFENEIKLDRQSLLDAIEAVSVVCVSENIPAKFIFENDTLIVQSHSSNSNRAETTVPIKYVGNKIITFYNPTFLAEPLKAIDDDEISININDGNMPAAIRCSVPFLYIIMPLRNQE